MKWHAHVIPAACRLPFLPGQALISVVAGALLRCDRTGRAIAAWNGSVAARSRSRGGCRECAFTGPDGTRSHGKRFLVREDRAAPARLARLWTYREWATPHPVPQLPYIRRSSGVRRAAGGDPPRTLPTPRTGRNCAASAFFRLPRPRSDPTGAGRREPPPAHDGGAPAPRRPGPFARRASRISGQAQTASVSSLSRVRSAATMSASRWKSASLTPGRRRRVNTTSHAEPSAMTRTGL